MNYGSEKLKREVIPEVLAVRMIHIRLERREKVSDAPFNYREGSGFRSLSLRLSLVSPSCLN